MQNVIHRTGIYRYQKILDAKSQYVMLELLSLSENKEVRP